MSRRVLYLDSYRLTAYRCAGGQAVADGAFEPSAEGLARFGEYLRQHAGDQYALLANLAEEGFQIEEIPFLRGADRSAVLSRRLAQVFFGTPLVAAVSLGYEKDKRRNERLLLAAFTNPAPFDPWLNTLKQAEVALSGVYSLAQLGHRLLAAEQTPPSRWMLLTTQDNTIRESFIVDGVTIFSRIAPLTDSSIAGTAATFAAEAAKLHQYLLGQRLVGRNEQLTVYLLTHPLTLRAVQKSCISNNTLNFEFLDSQQLAQRAGLKTPPTDGRCDPLFVHLLAARPPAPQYAGEELRHDFRLLQTRRGVLAFAGIAFAVALGFAAVQFFAGLHLVSRSEELSLRESELQKRYRDVTATFPQVQIDNDALRQLVGRYTELQRQQSGPRPAVAAVARALDRFPAVEIERLEWKQASGSDKGANKPEESLLIDGDLRLTRKSTPRQILAMFDSFVQALAREPGISVTVIQSPFDIGSGQALKGGKGDDPLPQRAFQLRLLHKGQP